jgi:RNA polymerase sigma-70 factor (ECF subfamily)
VVDEYGPAVYRLARSIVRDDALADDVTQETFIKVWRQLDTFRGDGSMRAWVLRIAHNTAVSTLRRIRDSAMPPDQLPARADPVGVHRVVEGRAALDELRDALDGLDDVSAAAVVLREVEGLSYDEIAEALAVPLPTVKTRLLRARRQLRVSMQEWRS